MARIRKKPTHHPEALPACPGCASTMCDHFQPAVNEPNRILVICLNVDCRTWTMYDRHEETGAWRVRTRLQAPVERIVRSKAIA